MDDNQVYVDKAFFFLLKITLIKTSLSLVYLMWNTV